MQEEERELEKMAVKEEKEAARAAKKEAEEAVSLFLLILCGTCSFSVSSHLSPKACSFKGFLKGQEA